MSDVLEVRNSYRAETWAMLIQECNSSGLTKREFCQQRGISEKSYYYWLRKLRSQIVTSSSPQLVQLDPKSLSEVLLTLPESQLICGMCGGTFKPIGKKFVRREIRVIPRQVKILEYYTVTYACDKCEKDTGYAHIISVQAPVPLMKHSLASASSVADIMTKKYVDGLPLARQEKIWAREGVELSRATMANWVIQCSQTWLKPLYKHMKQQLLTEDVIHADESSLQVLKEEGKPASSESRMWLYASGERSKTPVRIFEYQPDRSGKRPESFLKGFTGYLVTDGYSGYNQVSKVTHCGCWAHMRRKWREAMPDGATVKTSKAAIGFQYCTKLFSLENVILSREPNPAPSYILW